MVCMKDVVLCPACKNSLASHSILDLVNCCRKAVQVNQERDDTDRIRLIGPDVNE